MSRSPGTIEGRRKGGQISQQRRRVNPDYYRKQGCNVAKTFLFPDKSDKLAELFGIILGDGGITSRQLHITLNSVADHKYSIYVKQLIGDLLGECPHVYKRKDAKAVVLVVSGVGLINYLVSNGLLTGNKVVGQVDVPDWIKINQDYSTSCVRGLIDTDGGVFVHKYVSKGKSYSYLKINFTNMSQPLRAFIYTSLEHLGFHPKMQSFNKVWLYNEKEVLRYFQVIGSSNYRLLSKLKMI